MTARRFIVIVTETLLGSSKEYVYSGRIGMLIGECHGHFVYNEPQNYGYFRLLDELIAKDLAESFQKTLTPVHGEVHSLNARLGSVDFNFNLDSDTGADVDSDTNTNIIKKHALEKHED